MSAGRAAAPRVSVLLPVYNGTAHVGRAVESVLGQTFTDFELLVLDDSSPDDSAGVALGYGDPRVRVLRNERNMGQVATLNRGLREARGEYVARMDQDDVSLPRRFERQVAVLDSEPQVAVVGTWIELVDAHGTTVAEPRRRLDTRAEAVYLVLTDSLPLPHPSVMFRRRAIVDAGGYDEAVQYSEDMDLWRRLLLAGNGVRLVAEPLLRYRVHEGQQSHRHFDEQRTNNEASLERFVTELARDADARLVRLAFTRQLDLWRQLRSRADAARLAESLESLLAGAAERLELDRAELAELEQRVRSHIARTAAEGWRTGLRRWLVTSPTLARFGGRGRLRFAATYLASPLLVLARAVARRPAAGRE